MRKSVLLSLILLGILFLTGCGQQRTVAPSDEKLAQDKSSLGQVEIFKDAANKIEFKYNYRWSISPINTGSGYDPSNPYLLIWLGETSDEACQDLGCPPRSGDRDELTKGDTMEGGLPIYPWFKILRVRGNKWVSIQVTDVTKNCQTNADCQQYIALAPFEQKIKTDMPGYQAYNDFIELIYSLKFNE
jgi:hypothetical protein